MSKWFIFNGQALMLHKQTDGTYTIPKEKPKVALLAENNIRKLHITSETQTVFTANIPEFQITHKDYVMMDLRDTYNHISSEDYIAAGKCREILFWDSQTQYCGCCGSKMNNHTEISKICSSCGKEVWPLLAIAVIVLVRKGHEALLVKARNFKRDYYGLVAGFVETGETLEEAVAREVYEETGINIDNIRYFGSQPWPYPCGLMVGFYADYISGDIHIQEEEINNANWFNKNNLPPIPGKMSIARKLIDNWTNNNI